MNAKVGWYSPWSPPPGDLYVNDPLHIGGGTATLLPMTEQQMAAIRPKPPLGFGQSIPQAPAPVEEPPMWEVG